jgi:hypothetical protein
MRALLVVVALAAAAQAASWEATRRGVVDPLNSALHRHLPSHLKARDLEALLGLYATDAGTGLVWDGGEAVYTGREEEMVRWGRLRGPEPIRQRYQRLLDLLATIERAELRIDEVRWREAAPDGVPVDVHLIVRGARSDGARIQLDQRARLRVVERGGAWVITHEEITARETVARAVPRYDLATEPAGVHNTHTNASSPVFRLFGDGSQGTPVGNSAGSAVADVDGDGCEDVFLAGDPGAALYRNGCDGTFTDVTAEAGLPVPYPAAASGTVFFDYDNDGWPDLYVAAVRGGDRLFRNTGGGRFADVSGPARIPAGRWTSMPAVADYDRDGFLDVYLVRMGDHERTAPRPNYDARNGVGNALLHNNGDGTFSDATSRAGVGNRGWNLAGAWGDYDGDGWPDLYVANEFGGNVLYHNEGDGTFSDRTEASGTADGGAGMGVAWADYDGDGDLDLFVSNMHANSRWALFHPEFPSPVPWPFRVLGRFTPEVERRTRGILDRLTRGSTLFRNDGDGTFTDVSDAAGVRDAQWGWAAEFLDYDNDGRLDLYARAVPRHRPAQPERLRARLPVPQQRRRHLHRRRLRQRRRPDRGRAGALGGRLRRRRPARPPAAQLPAARAAAAQPRRRRALDRAQAGRHPLEPRRGGGPHPAAHGARVADAHRERRVRLSLRTHARAALRARGGAKGRGGPRRLALGGLDHPVRPRCGSALRAGRRR